MVLLIFVAVFIFRLILSFLPSFQIDMRTFIAWGERMANLGPVEFYSKDIFTNYLPGYLYVLWFFGEIRNLIQIPLNSQIYEVILKIPANLADLGIGVLIFKILKNYTGRKIALISSVFYIANPAIIFNSAVWGQNDSVFTFFLLLSALFLTKMQNPVAASLAFAASFLIKPQAVALLPVFGFFLFKKFQVRLFLRSLVLGLLLIFLISLPFFSKQPVLGLLNMFSQMAGEFPYTSLFAYNFWWVIGGWKNDLNLIFGIPAQIWGILLWVASQILILFWLFKNHSKENFYLAATISLLSFFVLPTRVHERYLFPFFAFGVISASIYGRIFWVILGVLTFVHFLNLYFVYAYYTPNFLKIESLIQLINDFSIALAAITVFILSLMIGLLFSKKWLKT